MKQTVLILAIGAGLLFVSAPREAQAQRRPPDRITREEIDASPHRTLDIYELIRRARPSYLEARGGRAGGAPMALYIDGRKQSGLDVLKSIAASRVQDVVYFDPERAATEFGAQAAAGALVVKLRRDAKP